VSPHTGVRRGLARDERGQVFLVAVLFMVGLLAMAAFVIDLGSWYRAQRGLQGDADAAALAGAQALPNDTAQATALAAEYASKNGLTLAPGAITISDRVQQNDTITVAASTSAPGFFSRLLGFNSVTVRAKAAAEAGQLGKPRYVAPIVVSRDHPLLSGPGCPCFNQDTDLPLDKFGAPGAFGLLNLDGHGGNGGPNTLADWILNGYSDYLDLGDYYSNTGAKFDSTDIDDALTQRIHTTLLFPVFDVLKDPGSNARYHVIGWVGFYLESFTIHGHTGDLVGHFTSILWQGLEAPNYNSNGPGNPAQNLPDYGARTIRLVQ